MLKMADTSNYSIWERLLASVWVRERQDTGKTMNQVVTAFRQRFGKPSTRRAAMFLLEKLDFSYGSVKGSPQSGRPTSRMVTGAAVALPVNNHRASQYGNDQRNLRLPR
jgi:hypothetical protein